MSFWRRSSPPQTAEEIACDSIRKSDLFDAEWYLDKYQDVRQAGFDPVVHYVRHGAQEGRQPGPWFDANRYLEAIEDSSEIENPLLHYLENRGALVVKDQPQKRGYSNLGEFFKFTLLSPLIQSPFQEEDKRCFAAMDAIAKYLVRALKGEEPDKVSIIMPVRNRVGTLQVAIDSVIEQTYRNFELIIIDDGSDDGSASLAEDAAAADARIRVIRLGQALGVCAARNAGLADAKGSVIAYLDSDNTWLESFLAASISALRQLPKADAIYSGQYIYAEDDLNRLSAVRFGPMNCSLLEQRNYIDLNCFVHRRSVINSGFRFNEALQRLVDWDFILQINSNFVIASVPVLLSRYYYHAAENTITKTVAIEPSIEHIAQRKKRLLPMSANLSLERPVCVVIPSYQALPFLRECVNSVASYLESKLFSMVIVDNNSDDDVKTYLREIAGEKVKILFNDVNYGFSYAVNQGVANAPADADIVLMNNDARFEIDSIKRLQEVAYEATDIAISVPRQIVPAKTEDINLHVPYADFNQACDVSLSVHHNNIDSLELLHTGRKIDLNFAPFFCVYIKRDVWDACEGLDYENGRHYRSDRIMCDFVKQMLNMRIVYTPDAIVYHAAQVATNELSRNGVDDNEHRMMLIKNIWPDDLIGELKISKRPWTDN